MHFVVDLHGPSKVPTSFKRYSLTLNNMDYAKMFCSRDMALFTYPGYPWQFSWTASTATVRYYPDKQSRSHPRIARINEVAVTVEKRMAARLG